jgi:hypothetical protein
MSLPRKAIDDHADRAGGYQFDPPPFTEIRTGADIRLRGGLRCRDFVHCDRPAQC